MEYFAAGLNYTGLASNTHVVNPIPNTHYRLFDKRFAEAFPKCKLWRVPISLNRLLKASQGMGLDETYCGYIEDTLDGLYALGGRVILDAHDFMRTWKMVEEIPGWTLGRDKADTEHYGKFYRISDGAVMSNDDYNKVDIAKWGSKYKRDPNRSYICHIHHVDKCLRLSEIHIMGQPGNPKFYNADGLTHTVGAMVKRFMNHPAIWGWEIMNEPHNGIELFDMDAYWLTQAPKIVSYVQNIDKTHFIIVDGNQYASASQWTEKSNALKDLPDPNNQILYAAHYYVDGNGGQWLDQKKTILPDAGTRPCTNFFNWLSKNKKRGIMTEFGHPAGNESAHIADKNLVELANSKNVCIIQWAAGPGWTPTNATAVNLETSTGVTVKDNIRSIEAALEKRLPSYNPV